MVYSVDPLRDSRWSELIDRHDSASVFHSVPWLQALHRTYGYKPVVYTTSRDSGPVRNGVLLCEIKSWLTGSRMVSLPFSDHCEPLVDSSTDTSTIFEQLRNAAEGRWKFVEIRPKNDMPAPGDAAKLRVGYMHTLDLRPDPTELLARMHKTAIQQPIKRAEREGLVFQTGTSERLLKEFYRLLLQTRRRHQLPPQPAGWFRNLIHFMGDRLQIRVAFRQGIGIASIVTIQHKNVMLYKYGCSDTAFQNLGGTPSLIWNAILDAKAAGLHWMDFGRSDIDNPGLITFKDRWGARASELAYFRWPVQQHAVVQRANGRVYALASRLFGAMPDAALQAMGRILYRHVG